MMRLQHLMLADAMSSRSAIDPRTPDEKARDAEEFRRVVADVNALNARAKREGWSPERFWAERLSRRAPWTTVRDLVVFLTDEWAHWTGHAPTAEERLTIDSIADAMWARRESERAVPVMVECAWCRVKYEQAKGFGVFCSRDCMIEEAEAPGGIAIAQRAS